MFVILWEYDVKPACVPAFVQAYGPGGDWVRLFQGDPHFRQTRLLQDHSCSNIYFTLDFWDSESAFSNFKAAHRDSYLALDNSCAELTTSERCLGSFPQNEPGVPAA